MHITRRTFRKSNNLCARFHPQTFDLSDLAATRRGLILAPLLAALPAVFFTDPAHAIDPTKPKSRCLINISGSPV